MFDLGKVMLEEIQLNILTDADRKKNCKAICKLTQITCGLIDRLLGNLSTDEDNAQITHITRGQRERLLGKIKD